MAAEIKPIMVPDNDGSRNEHQINPITSIDAVAGLRDWMTKVEKKIGGLN